MGLYPIVRARWSIRSWVQNPSGTCITYQSKKEKTQFHEIVMQSTLQQIETMIRFAM